ncbi:MAG: zf-TFIIB domain-containing protein [Armatimonadetes bacterium]|nr:zf-TFIIB domain-containing protein [Armatimonadota bacterium]
MAVCPRCSAELAPQSVGGVELDACSDCGGLWFDPGELGRLMQQGAGDARNAENLAEGRPSRAHGGGMACPRCGVTLYEFQYEHSPQVTLNACPECRGVWLDDGELQALASRRIATQETTASSPRARLRRNVRAAASLIQKVPCRRCGQANPTCALVCWACGTNLTGRRGAMLCPRCDSPLETRDGAPVAGDLADARLDLCRDCGGLWVSRDTLSTLVAAADDVLQAWQETLQLPEASQSHEDTRDDALVCPVCQVFLDRRAYAGDETLFVDRCLRCKGTWVDSGELVRMRVIAFEQEEYDESRFFQRPSGTDGE